MEGTGRGRSILMRRILGTSFLCLLVFGSSCKKETVPAEKTPPEKSSIEPLNLLLITVDCLRWDRVGFGGYEREVTPNMDRLAEEGTVFTRAYSQAGWTLPSLATLLTGFYPRDHGAILLTTALKTDVGTLAERLSQDGYETRGYVTHVLCLPEYGLNRGFDGYDHSVLDKGHPHDISTSKEVTDLALQGLNEAREPFFIWVHYFDPHYLYLPHEPWEHFGEDPSDIYDQEVAYTDQHVGRLLNAVREKGLLERTVVFLAGDHGEEFGEHGGSYHLTCHEEVLRIPMVVRIPSAKKREHRERVEQIDVVPTLLGLLGFDPEPGLPGKDVLKEDTRGFVERPLFVERVRPPGLLQKAVLRDQRKLILVETVPPENLSPSARDEATMVSHPKEGEYLYDLDADPGEKKNLISEADPKEIESLKEALQRFSETQSVQGLEIHLNEKRRDELRSLGYMN